MNNKNKYLLDIERLKKLVPIMEECGVDFEKYAWSYAGHEVEIFSKHSITGANLEEADYPVATFDHADLESVLPDWVFDIAGDSANEGYIEEHVCSELELCTETGEFEHLVEVCILHITTSRGQSKLEAMADLIILLHENGIELKTQS